MQFLQSIFLGIYIIFLWWRMFHFIGSCVLKISGLFLPAVVRPILDSLETSKQVPQPALSDVSIKFHKMFIQIINSFCLAIEWLHIQTYFQSLNIFSFLR